MAFKKDFSLGKKGENLVLNLFKKHGLDTELNTNKETRKDFDLTTKVGRKKVTVEIKYDWLAQKTNNLAFEYYNTNKDEASGIDCTKAILWIQIILDNNFPTIWMTSVKKLKDYIKKHKPLRVVENAGDGNANLYLYRDVEILEAIFKRIDNSTEEEIKKILKELVKN